MKFGATSKGIDDIGPGDPHGIVVEHRKICNPVAYKVNVIRISDFEGLLKRTQQEGKLQLQKANEHLTISMIEDCSINAMKIHEPYY